MRPFRASVIETVFETAVPVFAQTARQAYPAPGALGWLRGLAKSAVLLAAPRVHRPAPRFVRCLYAHALFPEHRAVFARVLAELRNRGDLVDLATLADLVAADRPEGRYFHLSFDDGFANVLENGAELLAEARVPATIFVCSGFPQAPLPVLQDHFRRMTAYRQPLRPMTWDEIAQFRAMGAEIGAHTRTHRRLSELETDPAALTDEIAGSRAAIEARTGAPCTAFAWPYGRAGDIGPQGRRQIARAGYRLAFSAERGRVRPGVSDPLAIPRHQIEFHWRMGDLRAWIDGFGE